jgi:hypothetical protein
MFANPAFYFEVVLNLSTVGSFVFSYSLKPLVSNAN